MSDVEVVIQLLFAVVCGGVWVFGIYRWGSIRQGYRIADDWDRTANGLAKLGAPAHEVQTCREVAADMREETRRFARRSGWHGLWERVLQREGREQRG